jgi:hypothetical protein
MTTATPKAGLVAALCLAALAAGTAQACDTPVFRYALERWQPDLYEAIVFHDGAMKPAEKKLADALAERAADEDAPINMAVRAIDVSGKMDAFSAGIWKQAKTDKLPMLAACYPRWMGRAVIAWSAPLTDEAIKTAVDSPARQQVAKRIIKGATAVWVLLECGDKKADDEAAQRVRTELDKLEKELELPVPQRPIGYEDETPPGPALKVEFPVVRVSAKDPNEQAFVKMLLRTEEDLESEYSGQPMVFPIFGRGRALFALVGKGIRQDNIEDACVFLVGRCSCQVKRQNPGVDMLIAADWEAAFEEVQHTAPQLPNVISAPTTAPTTGPTTEPAAAAPAAPAGSAGAAGQPEEAAEPLSAVGRLFAGSGLIRNTLIALGFIVLIVVFLVLRVSRRPARS